MSSQHIDLKPSIWSLTANLAGEKGMLRTVWQGSPGWLKRAFSYKLRAGFMLVLLAALVTASCGGSSGGSLATVSAGSGILYTTFGDTPACDVLSFSLYAVGLDLHPQGAPLTSAVTAYPTNSAPTPPVVEFAPLRDTSVIGNLTSVPSGTYDKAILRFIVNSAAKYDPTVSPPASLLKTNITTTTATVNIQPPLVISKGKTSVLNLDLNLSQSLAVNSQGQLTGEVTPVFSASAAALSVTKGLGEFHSLEGFILSEIPQSQTTGFTSSFVVQTLSGRGPALTVYTNDTTTIFPSTLGNRIDMVPTGSFIELDAYIDQNGNVVAKSIQVEAREDLSKQMLAYLGPVLTVTRDSGGHVTKFEMLVRYTEPSDTTKILPESNVAVEVSSSTTFNAYQLSSDLTNQANAGNLAFNDQTLVPGQEVVVHGVFSAPSGGPITVAADAVDLRLQSIQGDFSSLLLNGSDDKTGGFQFAPCSDLLSGSPYIVVTDNQTDFVNPLGLSAMTSASPLIARGLAFWDPQGGTVNGVQVPAGAMVVLANHIRQY